MNIRKDILQYNTRQGVAPVLSDFFSNHLNKLIEIGDETIYIILYNKAASLFNILISLLSGPIA